MADAAVGFLLEKLKEFVLYNADLIAGVEITANKLCNDLEMLKNYLKRCTEEYSDNEFVEKLVKSIRKLVYKAEDAIETYIATASKQKFRGTASRALHAMIDHPLELRKIGKELEVIHKEVQDLYNDIRNLAIPAMPVDKGHVQRGQKPPVSDDMVGFKDAMKEVMALLNGGTDDLQTISIVGSLGLGKTTLASQVFKHPNMQFPFIIRAFVEVSAEYKKKELFLKILHAFGIVTEEMNRMPEDSLREEIENYLEKRNFLIVLDDVWTTSAWDDLKGCFPNNQKHSRVLLTTRHKDVAEYAMQPGGFKPYDLRFLTNEESHELLRMRVFGKKDEIRVDLAEHETRILDNCKGLPLAIVVVAGILTNHREDSHWWSRVAENVNNNNNLATIEQVHYVIQLSFNNLPYRLKTCFLYLGVFREDFEIPSKTLLKLWVSEGFVPLAKENETSEDIAEDYLEELVDRSLVMVEKRRLNSRIKTIRVHDTLRAFCKEQAKKEELFQEIKRTEQDGSISLDDDRRICINSNVVEYIKSKPLGTRVRSFLSFAKEDNNSFLPVEHIPKAFKLLSVLDIRAIKLTRFPAELCFSFLLKYVAMSSEVKVIPRKMSNLRFLQTLIFDTTQSGIEIKADIWKMPQLRHLETNATTSLVKTKEAMSINANLQTLTAISPESCRSEVFERAPQLKKLGICGTLSPVLEVTDTGSLFDSLRTLDFLENLKLLNDNATVKICSFPNENSFPDKLKRLTLQNTMLDWVCMSTLGKLRKLEVLKLKDNAFSGTLWDTENDGFRALKVLHIGRTDLVTWKASASHFPSLTQLYLKHCTKLASIPLALIYISTLQLIDIYCCNCKVTTSARKLQILAKLPVKTKDKVFKNDTLKLSVHPPDK